MLLFFGLTPVHPNEARALVFVGRYSGTVRSQGLHWVNPFTLRHRVSVRIRNFETGRLKVNDSDGNPIEIAAVVVWKVTDTAEALFEVDDYENFVHVQAEAALRNLATSHPYDSHLDEVIALRSNPTEIAEQLRSEIADRLQTAGDRGGRSPDIREVPQAACGTGRAPRPGSSDRLRLSTSSSAPRSWTSRRRPSSRHATGSPWSSGARPPPPVARPSPRAARGARCRAR